MESHENPWRTKAKENASAAIIGLLGIMMLCGSLQLKDALPAHAVDLTPTQRRLILPIADFTQGRFINDMTAGTLFQVHSAAQGQKSALLAQSFVIHFQSDDGRVLPDWTIAFKDHPLWIDGNEQYASINETLMLADIKKSIAKLFTATASCHITDIQTDEMDVRRAQTSCVAKDGQVYDEGQFASDIHAVLHTGFGSVTVRFTAKQGSLINETPENFGELILLGTGHSDFAGSGDNRKANVRKAINERVNNVVVAPGAVFSFNRVLGPSLSSRYGWYMALGIFGGTDLLPTPGGGICQASTTTYRGVLQAGLPVLEHRSHSIYVHYYEAYGVGQDATVFLGSQDFTFQNDTPGSILIQSYTQGDEAFVKFYGIDDGRRVTLDGPYFSKNAPADMLYNGRPIRSNQIAWVRHIQYADNQKKHELFVSQYKALPRTLADRMIAQKAQTGSLAMR